MSKTDRILRRKEKSSMPSIVRRIDPVTGEVIERILLPAQDGKRTIPRPAWPKAKKRP